MPNGSHGSGSRKASERRPPQTRNHNPRRNDGLEHVGDGRHSGSARTEGPLQEARPLGHYHEVSSQEPACANRLYCPKRFALSVECGREGYVFRFRQCHIPKPARPEPSSKSEGGGHRRSGRSAVWTCHWAIERCFLYRRGQQSDRMRREVPVLS